MGGAPRVSVEPGRAAHDVLRLSCDALGWTLVPAAAADADVLWVAGHSELLRVKHLLRRASQRVSLLPGAAEVCAKVEFATLMNRAALLFPERYAPFWPETFALPDDRAALERYLHGSRGTRWVIVKPDGGSQGDGIFLSSSMADIDTRLSRRPSQRVVVQRYIAPHTLGASLGRGGSKWDSRVFVLVTSVEPLEVHVAHEGLARVCVERYMPPTKDNARAVCAHLTNYSLNKLHEGFEPSAGAEDGASGHKRALSAVLRELAAGGGGGGARGAEHGFSEAGFWRGVHRLVGATLAALLPSLRDAHAVAAREMQLGTGASGGGTAASARRLGPRTCFHVLGFDVMLDRHMQPHLLEVNASPSLAIDSIEPLSADELLDGGGIAAYLGAAAAAGAAPAKGPSAAASAAGAAAERGKGGGGTGGGTGGGKGGSRGSSEHSLSRPGAERREQARLAEGVCVCMAGAGRPHRHAQSAVDAHVKRGVTSGALRLALARRRRGRAAEPPRDGEEASGENEAPPARARAAAPAPYVPLDTDAAALGDFALLTDTARAEFDAAAAHRDVLSSSAFSRWARAAQLDADGLTTADADIIFTRVRAQSRGGEVRFGEFISLILAVSERCYGTRASARERAQLVLERAAKCRARRQRQCEARPLSERVDALIGALAQEAAVEAAAEQAPPPQAIGPSHSQALGRC